MNRSNAQKKQRQSWTPMQMQPLGNVAEVVRGGGGKLTPPFADTGDIRKPKGQE